MILPSLRLHSRVNKKELFTGLDSAEHCLNNEHFKNYPYPISYEYNSRGFRDKEWPDTLEELKNSIWCLGDSFTSGIGSPVEHTWVNLLESATGKRCINVSLDGASNSWILRKFKEIKEAIDPAHIIIQWSYLHRREKSGSSDENRRVGPHYEYLDEEQQYKDFLSTVEFVDNYKTTTNVIHSIIPNSGLYFQKSALQKWELLKGTSWPSMPTNESELKNLPDFVVAELEHNYQFFKCGIEFLKDNNWQHILEVEQHDYARDYHHYDKLTADIFVNQLLELI